MFGLDPLILIVRMPALLLAMTIHEYAHARVADWQGDPTPRYEGRLTLNPLVHVDWLGLLMLWLFRFGWAKPVMINPHALRNGKLSMTLVAFGGPAANILLAFLALLSLHIVVTMQIPSFFIRDFLGELYRYNLIFAVFNLLPIPPLDGSKIIEPLLPRRVALWYEQIAPYAPFLFIALIYLGVIGKILGPIVGILSIGLSLVVQLLTGWFL